MRLFVPYSDYPSAAAGGWSGRCAAACVASFPGAILTLCLGHAIPFTISGCCHVKNRVFFPFQETGRVSVRACVFVFLFFSFLVLECILPLRDPWFVQKKKKGAFSSRIYTPISPAVSCSRGSKSDHVSCIEDIDIWSQVLDLRYFLLTAVFFLLPEGMVSSDQDVRG